MLSALAHGLALAWWLHAHQHEDNAPSIGQKRGSLTVTIAPVPRVPRPQAPPVVPPRRHTPLPTPRVLATRTEVAHPTRTVAQAALPPDPPSLPASSGLLEDTSPAPAPAEPRPAIAPQAPAASQPDAPGARFANLFAPIISRPLGRGRWQTRPSAPAFDERDAAMQREQAIQGTRQALYQRVEALRQSLHQAPLVGRCAIRISLTQQAAQLDCTEQVDLQRLSPQFGTVLSLQARGTPVQADSCLVVQQFELRWQACPDVAEGATPGTTAATP